MKRTSPFLLPCLASLCFVPLACAQIPAQPGAQTAQTAQNPQPAKGYTFVYRADKKLQAVSVAGTFNNWNSTANPMRVDADGLTWRATLPLELGKYGYKFVLNGNNWIVDPTTATETDADNNANSVLTLSAQGNTSLAPPTATTPGNADKVVVLTPDKVKDPDALPQTFTYRADKKLDSVSVAGQFNGWNSNADALTVGADGLTWSATLPLAVGSYQYKFVLNGDTWIVDPNNPRRFTEANGNVNSLVVVAPSDYDKPASPDDGQTTVSALRHEQNAAYLNFDRGKLLFSLRTRPNDLRAVRLVVGTRGLPMKLVKSDEPFAFYQTEMAWDGKTDLAYRFELVDGSRTELFGANGLATPTQPFQVVAKNFKPFVVPDWVERAVFYQIFPDRFENGDKTNDPPNVVAWNSAPTGNSRFGGDIAGVKQHLPYLSDLGISGVYFNPVFKSPSPHRYDAQDYKQIDPAFGTNAQFAALTRELQKRGIRTVMDFVFNHTSTQFPAFADVRKNGAASPYKDWYLVKSFPVRVQNPPNYLAWGGFSAMPKLNLMNPATGDYMLNLVNYWKGQVPLAGLRLDVADEVDIRFWRQLRTRVKGLDPQTWIVGERWQDASPWLRGDQWDSAMNYPFLDANVAFFAEGKTSASEFIHRLMEIYNSYPPQVSRNMMNLLSSHDKPRFLTVAKNDAHLQQLAATLQFTWPGAPSIYYGEELAMQGGPDPDNRRGMEWNRATNDNPMLRFYKRLIQVRNNNRVLQSGDPAILLSDDANKTLAYSRTLGDDVAIMAFNRSDKTQTLSIPLSSGAATTKARIRGFSDALSGQKFSPGNAPTLTLKLAPLSSAILLPIGSS